MAERLGALEGLTLAGETLKTRPKGFDAEHPRIDLPRHKGLYAWRAWEPDDVLHEPGTLDRVASTWRMLLPLTEWLADHVGSSEQPRR